MQVLGIWEGDVGCGGPVAPEIPGYEQYQTKTGGAIKSISASTPVHRAMTASKSPARSSKCGI